MRMRVNAADVPKLRQDDAMVKSTKTDDPKASFQDLILRLERFWADQGCVILQPYDIEMGAGTFHPATALRYHRCNA